MFGTDDLPLLESFAIQTPSLTDPYTMTLTGGDVPWPGSKFAIRLKNTDLVFTRIDSGQVILSTFDETDMNQQWHCVESRGWIGFWCQSSPVGRTYYLGVDSAGSLIAQATAHNGWEDFALRLSPHGGYYMMVKYWNDFRPIDWAPNVLMRSAQDGCRFEFIKLN